MITLTDLFEKKEKYEAELEFETAEFERKKSFINAKLAVVDEMITDEKCKVVCEEPQAVCEEINVVDGSL